MHDEEDDDDDATPPASQNPPPNPNPLPVPVTLFEENFSGAYPGTAWTTPSPNGPGPTAAISAGDGNPAPALTMTTSAGPDPLTASGPLFILTDSTMTFTGAPLTVSVDMMVPAAGEGSGSIAILDGTNTPVAAAEWHPTTSFGAITFMIADSVNPTPATTGVPPPPPGAYHNLRFSVDAGGQASWSLDGGASVLTHSGFPPGPYKVRLYLMVASPTGPFATFHFDNVLVTTP
jgi:hypothetical protein